MPYPYVASRIPAYLPPCAPVRGNKNRPLTVRRRSPRRVVCTFGLRARRAVPVYPWSPVCLVLFCGVCYGSCFFAFVACRPGALWVSLFGRGCFWRFLLFLLLRCWPLFAGRLGCANCCAVWFPGSGVLPPRCAGWWRSCPLLPRRRSRCCCRLRSLSGAVARLGSGCVLSLVCRSPWCAGCAAVVPVYRLPCFSGGGVIVPAAGAWPGGYGVPSLASLARC